MITMKPRRTYNQKRTRIKYNVEWLCGDCGWKTVPANEWHPFKIKNHEK